MGSTLYSLGFAGCSDPLLIVELLEHDDSARANDEDDKKQPVVKVARLPKLSQSNQDVVHGFPKKAW